jgi:hypothetical protein
VSPFQWLVRVNRNGPQESQNKHSREQAGNDNAFLETGCGIKVSKARDRVPALDVSANRHILVDQVQGVTQIRVGGAATTNQMSNCQPN